MQTTVTLAHWYNASCPPLINGLSDYDQCIILHNIQLIFNSVMLVHAFERDNKIYVIVCRWGWASSRHWERIMERVAVKDHSFKG